MPEPSTSEWRDSFVLASRVGRSGRSSEFYRAVHAGRFHRLVDGVYLPSVQWAALDTDERYLAIVHATARSSIRDLVFSHHSAAALWRLPMVRQWPERAEITVGDSPSGETRVAFTARKYPLPETTDTIEGLRVTTLARTCVDVARTAQWPIAVPMLDAALAGRTADSRKVGRWMLEKEFRAVHSRRGMARCRGAFDLANGLSGSPGESLSRVGMHILGLPKPTLQQPFYDADGLVGITDFWWPEYNLVGEFDGRGKYLREELLRGRSTADALLAEKDREDRLRALSLRVTRWGWRTAASLELLGAHLRRAGLR